LRLEEIDQREEHANSNRKFSAGGKRGRKGSKKKPRKTFNLIGIVRHKKRKRKQTNEPIACHKRDSQNRGKKKREGDGAVLTVVG